MTINKKINILKTFFFFITIIFLLGCKTNKVNYFVKIKSSTDKNQMVKFSSHLDKYTISFLSELELKNFYKREKILLNIHIMYNEEMDYSALNIFKEDGDFFGRSRTGSLIKPNEDLKLRVIFSVPLDSLQTRKIAEYYKIDVLPKWKDTISLTNYQNFSSDLKTLKTDSGKSLYDEVFHKIEFNLLFQDKLEEKQAELIIYDWLNDTTYKPE